ncbi:hypothetical protein ACLRE7_00645 [Mycoplasmopsis meleagridis]|uniref:hypothetical protein n=1 Tax=Mycoplasmopsis meleagridis TaxID=29561 RepID=UPI003A85933A
MKIQYRVENEFMEFDLELEEIKNWLNIDILDDEMEEEIKEKVQEKINKEYNRPEYNIYHRETRHIDPTPKKRKMDGTAGYICASEEDDSFNILDYLGFTIRQKIILTVFNTREFVASSENI